jgi:hypothetical protein
MVSGGSDKTGSQQLPQVCPGSYHQAPLPASHAMRKDWRDTER